MDWWKVDRSICEAYSMKPCEIDDLTIPEIVMLLDDPQAARPHGGRGQHMTTNEVIDHCRAWAKLTPRQKLEQAMRNG